MPVVTNDMGCRGLLVRTLSQFLLIVPCLLAGCTGSSSGHWYERPKTSKQWLDIALEAPNADDRRQGVVGLSQSSEGRSDWAMKVYDTIARTDKDTMVRTTAVGAMKPAAGPEQVATLLKILGSQRQRFDDVHPAPGPLRAAAAKVIFTIVDDQRYTESQREEIVKALLERLSKDDDRNVRLTAIDTLAYFAQQPIPWALVEVLLEEDFALQNAAERALIAMTGVTHRRDAAAWKKWLGSTKDPFEKAGQTPDGM
jgi:hypothetical protein